MKYIVVFCIFCNTNYPLQIYYLIMQVPQSLCASYLIHAVGETLTLQQGFIFVLSCLHF